MESDAEDDNSIGTEERDDNSSETGILRGTMQHDNLHYLLCDHNREQF